MLPEADLIKNEIILRELVLSPDIKLSKKKQVRWLAISLGLISPGESRTLVIDVFEAILDRMDFPFTSEDIVDDVCDMRKAINQDERKKIDKAVRYHITRLLKLGILERKKRKYSWLRSDMTDDPIKALKSRVEFIVNIVFNNMTRVYSSYSASKKHKHK